MPSDSDDSVDWDSLETVRTFDGLNSGPVIKRVPANNGNGEHAQSTSAPGSAAGSTQLANGASFIDHITHNASTPVSLLVESLIQQLCSMLDTDPQRSSALYMRICEQLHKMRLIDDTYAMGEFDLMRSQYQRALYQLVSVARDQELPLAVQSVWPLTQPVGMDWSRYHREFDQLALVARGGFGQVFRARHKLDGIVYAVKKVTIKSITIGRILSHLAEVKTLAGLNHQNVVAYKAAWLEPLLEDPAMAVKSSGVGDDEDEDDEEEEEDETESSISLTCGSQFGNFSEPSDFIQFKASDHLQQSGMLVSPPNQRSQQVSVFDETQAHLNLKWATLYIQMTLCQMTLREWLDERNKTADDFRGFYAKFQLNFHSTEADGTTADFSPLSTQPAPDFDEVAHETFRQMVTGLDYIHSRGIIHHDIKPSNVFVGRERNGRMSVQLGDFGLACPLQEAHSGNNLIGTPTYAAPEQLAGRCDPKSDIFSLGVVLVELLMPFGTDMERIRTIEAVRRQEVPEKFPQPYAKLLRRLVAAETTARPDTAHIIAELSQIRHDDTAQAAQRQVDILNAELTSLRLEISTQHSTIDGAGNSAADSMSLLAQLSSKDDEIRTKNNEIWRLQRKIVQMRRTTVEKRSKDAEIRRLRAALRRKNSRSDELVLDEEEEVDEEVDDDKQDH